MKRLAPALLGLALAAPAPAQETPPAVSDVPTGAARLQGRVVRAESGTPVPDTEVALYALPPGGPPGVRRSVSDAEGRFAFESISADPGIAYLVGARHRGVPFPGDRIAFEPGQTERSVEIRVTDLTRDASSLAVKETSLRVEWAGGRLRVAETHLLENGGADTIYLPSGARGGARAPFEARLPAGAEDFRAPLGVEPEGLERRDDEVRFYGPLYPGPQQLSFSYTLPAAPGRAEVSKTLPSGAGRFVVRAPEDGPPLRGEALVTGEPVVLDGRRFAERVAEGLAPGSRVAFALELPAVRVDADAVALEEARIFLEYDDAVLLVREEHRFEVAGDSHLAAPAETPLLHVPLPGDAEAVRFASSAFAWGLSAAPGGGAALYGPLPPGPSLLEIAYRVPLAEATARFERRFTKPLPLLSLFVVDTGLRAESERLHRRRPVRSGEQTFLHLEAFQIEPDESVRLTLAPLPARGGLSRRAVLALVAAVAVLLVAVLTGPLRGGTAEAEDETLATEVERRERDALYEAMRDLEHDHETGKVSDEDHESMRRQLRGRAVALLRAERRGEAERPVASQPASCPSCGAEPRADDRFCARCGTQLPTPAGEREASG